MKPRAIVLSGRICSGKSTLAANLTAALNATPISSKEVLLRRVGRPPRTPVAWRRAAERVEQETDGEWLSDALNRLLLTESTTPAVVVDSVMTAKQVLHIRQGGWSVLHVHLGASEQALIERFDACRSE